MILRPCLRCPHARKPCDRRDTMRAKLRGTGVTSALFTCPERLAGLEPGRRVSVKVFGGDYGDARLGYERIDGTVVCRSGKVPLKILVRLDENLDPVNDSRYVKVWPDNCEPMEETRPLCASEGCRHPLEPDGTCPDRWHEGNEPSSQLPTCIEDYLPGDSEVPY